MALTAKQGGRPALALPRVGNLPLTWPCVGALQLPGQSSTSRAQPHCRKLCKVMKRKTRQKAPGDVGLRVHLPLAQWLGCNSELPQTYHWEESKTLCIPELHARHSVRHTHTAPCFSETTASHELRSYL